jgi:hypothetical protein
MSDCSNDYRNDYSGDDFSDYDVMAGEFDNGDYGDEEGDHPKPSPPTWNESFHPSSIDSLTMKNNFGNYWGYRLQRALTLELPGPVTDHEVSDYVCTIGCYGKSITEDQAYRTLVTKRRRESREYQEFFISARQDCQLLRHHFPFQAHKFRPCFYEDLEKLLEKLASGDEESWDNLDNCGSLFPKRDLLFDFLRIYMLALNRARKFGWYNNKLPLEEYDGATYTDYGGTEISSFDVNSIDEARAIARDECRRNIIAVLDKKTLTSGQPSKLSLVETWFDECYPPYAANPDHVLFMTSMNYLGYDEEGGKVQEPWKRDVAEAVWRRLAWNHFYGVTLLAYRWKDGGFCDVLLQIRQFL